MFFVPVSLPLIVWTNEKLTELEYVKGKQKVHYRKVFAVVRIK